MRTTRALLPGRVNELHRYEAATGKGRGERFHSGTLGEGMRAAISEIKKAHEAMIEGVERMICKDGTQSPAGDLFDEAIELGIEERSHFPERASFIDVDMDHTESAIDRAAEDGYHVVLVFPGHGAQFFSPEQVLGRPPAHPRPSLLAELRDQRLDD